jgi:hypothetical protein
MVPPFSAFRFHRFVLCPSHGATALVQKFKGFDGSTTTLTRPEFAVAIGAIIIL